MAIPTMFHSTTTILEPKGTSVLAYLGEEAASAGTEGDQAGTLSSNLGTAKLVGAKEAGSGELSCVSVIAQAEGDETQEFIPSSTEYAFIRLHHNNRPLLEHDVPVGEVLPEAYGKEHRTKRSQRQRWEKHRKDTDCTRGSRRERGGGGGGGGKGARERQQQDGVREEAKERRRRRRRRREEPSVVPKQESSSSDDWPQTSSSTRRAQDTRRPCPGREHRGWPRGATLPPACEPPSTLSLAGLCPQGGSRADWPCRGTEGTCDYGFDSLCLYTAEKRSCDSSCCTVTAGSDSLCSRAEAEWGSASSYAAAFDSVCIYTERRRSYDSPRCTAEAEWGIDFSCRSTEAGSGSDSLCSSAGADWGSASSRCGTPGDSDSSWCTVGSDSSSDSLRPGFEGRRGSPCLYADSCSDSLPSSLEGEVGSYSSCRAAEHWEPVLKELRGVVTQVDRHLVSSFFREMVREATEEKGCINEGFLFHPQKLLQPRCSEYREGREYSLLHHIQNGSYGDVFCVRDKNTGFKCAAKKIPVCSFNWEEVGTWSTLDSPRVLQLFGAVREGPNIILFMDLKQGSLAQLLRVRGCLSEGEALHYHSQVLQALEHLHKRHVVHLDLKVDNVLLSVDVRYCFLCDFGLSEKLDLNGHSSKAFRGYRLRGTETHMAPEVAKGEPRCAKADVWSSCCMLLHMLNGCHPWTRFYAHPLCLKIVSEPPPLWEIPPDCDPRTAEVFRAGLVKDPSERASAAELQERVSKALRAVGWLTCPVEGFYQDLANTLGKSRGPDRPHVKFQKIPDLSDTTTPSPSEETSAPTVHWVSTWRERAQEEDETDWEETDPEEESDRDADGDLDERREEEEEEEEEEEGGLKRESDCRDTHLGEEKDLVKERRGWEEEGEWEEREAEEKGSDLESLRELGSDWAEEEEEWEPFHRLQILYGPRRPGPERGRETEREGLTLHSPSHPHSPEQLLTCPHSTCVPQQEPTDKDSDWSDDLSSGVFSSYNSLTDGQSFNMDWLVSTNQPPSCCFEGLGVDIWIENFSGESLRIRERPKVKVGHVAMGISEQISMRTFSLATLDGKLVGPDKEVLESGTWLQCVPAPDGSPGWDWRIKDGQLEMRE